MNADTEMKRLFRLVVIREAIRRGELTLENKTNSEIEEAIKDYIRKSIQGESNINLIVTFDSQASLLERARQFVKEMEYELACVFYATWVEHWANNVVDTILIRRKLDEKLIPEIIRGTSLRGKLTEAWS